MEQNSTTKSAVGSLPGVAVGTAGEHSAVEVAIPIVGSSPAVRIARLVHGATDALGRDLTQTELRRIVDAGPHAGKALADPDVHEWLALLEFATIEPQPYENAWDAFVAERIDATVQIPEWLPMHAQAELFATVDEFAAQGLREAGWMWGFVDSDAVVVDDLAFDDIDDMDDPSVGVPGFVFRVADSHDAIVRHMDISSVN